MSTVNTAENIEVDERAAEDGLVTKNLTLWEGVAMIVGNKYCGGLLAISFASWNCCFFPFLVWFIVVWNLTTNSVLYGAETKMRTRSQQQLRGLTGGYVGKIGAWLIFI